MINKFLNQKPADYETAILLDKAIQTDVIPNNAPACTDGEKVYINTEKKLEQIFPEYNDNVLRWLLWHEKFHNELKHPQRYQKIKYNYTYVTSTEVNIIMDILVHDSLSKMFSEDVELMYRNGGQFRDRNSLKYTFKSTTLEDMIAEWSDYKGNDYTEPQQKQSQPQQQSQQQEQSQPQQEKYSKEERKEAVRDTNENYNTEELLDKSQSTWYDQKIEKLKNLRVQTANLTTLIAGLATGTRYRTYRSPSYINTPGTILKGSRPIKAKLKLCFDASGSMQGSIDLFKDVIMQSVPQALNAPCDWFTSEYSKDKKFKDMLDVRAANGFDDDGDRTIELCYEAEQKGYSPIGITDGGGELYHIETENMLKHMHNTIIVTNNKYFQKQIQEIAPHIRVIYVDV